MSVGEGRVRGYHRLSDSQGKLLLCASQFRHQALNMALETRPSSAGSTKSETSRKKPDRSAARSIGQEAKKSQNSSCFATRYPKAPANRHHHQQPRTENSQLVISSIDANCVNCTQNRVCYYFFSSTFCLCRSPLLTASCRSSLLPP